MNILKTRDIDYIGILRERDDVWKRQFFESSRNDLKRGLRGYTVGVKYEEYRNYS